MKQKQSTRLIRQYEKSLSGNKLVAYVFNQSWNMSDWALRNDNLFMLWVRAQKNLKQFYFVFNVCFIHCVQNFSKDSFSNRAYHGLCISAFGKEIDTNKPSFFESQDIFQHFVTFCGFVISFVFLKILEATIKTARYMDVRPLFKEMLCFIFCLYYKLFGSWFCKQCADFDIYLLLALLM